MSQNLKLNPGTLAGNCYPASPQSLYNEMFARGSALIGDLTGIIISDTAPDANDRDKGWLKTSAGNPVYGLIFKYSNGFWLTPHPCPPSGLERRLWVGNSTTDITSYDGGSAGAVGDASGPMWEVDTSMAGRFLVAPGTIPGAAGAPTIAVTGTSASDGTAGEWKHTLTMAELPDANLNMAIKSGQTSPQDPGTTFLANPASSLSDFTLTAKFGGGGQSHITAPPFYGIYVIRRTARKYIVG